MSGAPSSSSRPQHGPGSHPGGLPRSQGPKLRSIKYDVRKNYYKVIDADPKDTQDEIRKKYKVAMRHNHPDKVRQRIPDAQDSDFLDATKETIKIMEAFEIVGDPELRDEWHDAAVAYLKQKRRRRMDEEAAAAVGVLEIEAAKKIMPRERGEDDESSDSDTVTPGDFTVDHTVDDYYPFNPRYAVSWLWSLFFGPDERNYVDDASVRKRDRFQHEITVEDLSKDGAKHHCRYGESYFEHIYYTDEHFVWPPNLPRPPGISARERYLAEFPHLRVVESEPIPTINPNANANTDARKRKPGKRSR